MDDAPLPLFAHHLRGATGAQIGAAHVRRQLVIDQRVIHLEEVLPPQVRRVVDQHIHRAESLTRLYEQSIDVLDPAEIAGRRHASAPNDRNCAVVASTPPPPSGC